MAGRATHLQALTTALTPLRAQYVHLHETSEVQQEQVCTPIGHCTRLRPIYLLARTSTQLSRGPQQHRALVCPMQVRLMNNFSLGHLNQGNLVKYPHPPLGRSLLQMPTQDQVAHMVVALKESWIAFKALNLDHKHASPESPPKCSTNAVARP